MIKPITHDIFLLSQKAQPADEKDLQTARDLIDTLMANRERCVGMAANMIGVNKSIIAVADVGLPLVMFNPEIISQSGEYTAEEGCLSLTGTRKAKRYRVITVKYQDMAFKPQVKQFAGFTAQIIQHEIDHTKGIII